MRLLSRWRRRAAAPHPGEPLTAQDVVGGYRLLLGRRPETEAAVRDKLGLDRDAFLGSLLGSQEFEREVVQPIVARGGFRAPEFALPPERELLAWAAGFVTMAPRAAAAIAAAQDWFAIWRALAVGGPPSPLRTMPEVDGALADLSARARADPLAGAVEEVLRGRVRGWAMDAYAREGGAKVRLLVDGRPVADVQASAFRRDLQDRYGGDGRYSLEVRLPPDLDLKDDASHTFQLQDASSDAAVGAALTLAPAVERAGELQALRDERRTLRRRMRALERRIDQAARPFGYPLEMYDAYRRAQDARSSSKTAAGVASMAGRPRLLVLAAAEAGASTDAKLGSADFVLLTGEGETLAPEALSDVALAFERHPLARLLYGDADHVVEGGDGERFTDPLLRTDYDPLALLQEAAWSGCLAVETAALRQALADGASLAGGKRHDLTLRLVEAIPPSQILHLPRVLSRAPAGAAQTATDAQAVRAHLHRRGLDAEVEPHVDPQGAERPGALRVRWTLAAGVRAAAIIPTRGRPDLLAPCLQSLFTHRVANVAPLEVILVDGGDASRMADFLRENGWTDEVRLLRWDAPFNWAAINNVAARETGADVLIFLNDDTRAVTPDWSDELCRQALQPGVGAVGARLLYEDGTIQHAGVLLAGGHIDHEGVGSRADDPGYLGRHTLVRRVSAVTGACLATPAAVFRELGGFDADAFPIEANDVDYCLRLERRGLVTLYDPFCTLHHLESKSRGHSATDPAREAQTSAALDRLWERWGDRLESDPFYNPHFDRSARPFTQLAPPPEL